MYPGQIVYATQFNGYGRIVERMAYDPDDVEPWYMVEYEFENGIAYKRSFFPKSSLSTTQENKKQ